MTQNQIAKGVAESCTPKLQEPFGTADFQVFLQPNSILSLARYSPGAPVVQLAFFGNTEAAKWIIHLFQYFNPKNQSVPNVVVGESPSQQPAAEKT